MSNNSVLVKFLYFQLTVDRIVDKSRKKMLFDLTQFAEKVKELDLNARSWKYNGDPIRLKNFRVDENDLLLMQFERLTNNAMPYIAKASEESERDVPLDDDEFIANDINAIFDLSNSVLMLQRNIHALSPKAIIQYINYFWNEDRAETEWEVIEFVPIIDPNIYDSAARNSEFKKLTVKTANKYNSKNGVRNMLSEAVDGVLGNIIKASQPVSGLNLEVTFSTARSKDDTLNDSEVKKIIQEIREHENYFEKAELSVINNGHTEVLNLLNALLLEKERFEQPPKTRLRSDVVLDRMKYCYLPANEGLNRKLKINLMLRDGS